MSDLAIGVLAFACVFGGALFGMFVRSILPEHHLSDATKDVVKLGTGLIATMTALILGLLLASARSEYDAADTALRNSAIDVIKLDRALAHYGPETAPIRQGIRRALVHRIELMWPEGPSQPTKLDAPGLLPVIEAIETGTRGLAPANDTQRDLKSRAMQLASNVLDVRWFVLAQHGDTTSPVFLGVVIGWLTIVFTSFGLFAPRNWTVVVVLGVCAASVASALFLIQELASPFGGLIKLSGASLRFALSQLGQ